MALKCGVEFSARPVLNVLLFHITEGDKGGKNPPSRYPQIQKKMALNSVSQNEYGTSLA